MKIGTLLLACMLAAMIALAACGDDDDDGNGGAGGGEQAEAPAGPAGLTITATDDALEAPPTVPPGVTQITLENEGKEPASGQLIRVEGDHPRTEVARVFGAIAGRGARIPDWFLAGGGVGTTAPGKSAVVTQELQEGTYYVFNDEDESNIKKGLYTSFQVSGEPVEGELPSGSSVTATEYEFETAGITAGEPVVFENAGQEPHHLVAIPLKPGRTAADALRFFKTEKGEPPLAGEGSATTVIDAGGSLAVDLPLKKGDYALACFIADRAGGPPHVAKGMVSAAKVE
jgi:hypothetical protein